MSYQMTIDGSGDRSMPEAALRDRVRRTNTHEMVGRKFGRLTAIEVTRKDGAHTYFVVCECDCGARAVVRQDHLSSRRSRSCGCLKREATSRSKRTHGHAVGGRYTREYATWISIRDRCFDPASKAFANYGGRGISMSPRWASSFEQFLADVGPHPGDGYSIDRINTNAGYEPGNVRWATKAGQAHNMRTNKITREIAEEIKSLYAAGERKCHIARRMGVSYSSVKQITAGKQWRTEDREYIAIHELALHGGGF